MKKLMIDMDNVITDAYFIETVNDFLGTDYKLNEQKDFLIQNLIPKDKKEAYWNFIKEKTFYDEKCPLIEGAYEAIEKLNKKYELYIVTAYLYIDSNPDISGNNLRNKYEYLKAKLPFIKPQQYIFMDNKNLINWDIAIDDRISNLKSADKKILMTAWHNKELTEEKLNEQGIVRVSSWSEIEKILEV